MIQYPKLKSFSSTGKAEPINSNNFPVLQSGFVSFTKDGLLRPPPHEDMMLRRILMKDFMISNLDQYYNGEVTAVYEEWRADPSLMRTFEFRERVLLAAFKAFACENMHRWFTVQLKLHSLSIMHEKFLEETLNFIKWNTPRTIEATQWEKFIEHPTKLHNTSLDADKWLTGDDVNYYISTTIDKFLAKWVSRVNGFEDLLISLNVIFGSKAAITNVREKGV
jgi:hypothetical protein